MEKFEGEIHFLFFSSLLFVKVYVLSALWFGFVCGTTRPCLAAWPKYSHRANPLHPPIAHFLLGFPLSSPLSILTTLYQRNLKDILAGTEQ